MLSAKQDPLASPSRRRLRLHWLSWIVLVVVSAALVVIIVPGQQVNSIEWERQPIRGMSAGSSDPNRPRWFDYDFISVSVWSHGWPFEYLRRPISSDFYQTAFSNCPIMWMSPGAWPSAGRAYRFSFSSLLVDFLIAATVVAIAVSACELWRRRRRGFRFSLIDIGVATAAVCSILGWWQWHVQFGHREKAAVDAMRARGNLTVGQQQWDRVYCGPDWLCRLLGTSEFLRFCCHVDNVSLKASRLSKDDYRDIQKLSHIRSIHLSGTIDAGLVACIAALPKFDRLSGNHSGFDGTEPFQAFVTSQEVPLLLQLKRLRELQLGNCDLSSADLAILSEMPNLERLEFCCPKLLIEDLAPLAHSRSLKVLEADIAVLSYEQIEFNESHPNISYRGPHAEPVAQNRGPYRAAPPAVAAALFNRWGSEDGANDPIRVFDPNETVLSNERWATKDAKGWIITELDFSQLKLNRQRLNRLPDGIFADVDRLSIGAIDSPATAIELIRSCEPLEFLSIEQVPLAIREMVSLELAPDATLSIQQGLLTVDDCRELVQHFKLASLSIAESSFTPADVKRIQDASPDVVVEVREQEDTTEADRPQQPKDDPDSPFG